MAKEWGEGLSRENKRAFPSLQRQRPPESPPFFALIDRSPAWSYCLILYFGLDHRHARATDAARYRGLGRVEACGNPAHDEGTHGAILLLKEAQNR